MLYDGTYVVELVYQIYTVDDMDSVASGTDFSDVAAHTGSGDHLSSSLIDIEDSSPGGIAQYEAVLSPQIWCHCRECLVICIHTPIRLHGMSLDWKETILLRGNVLNR